MQGLICVSKPWRIITHPNALCLPAHTWICKPARSYQLLHYARRQGCVARSFAQTELDPKTEAKYKVFMLMATKLLAAAPVSAPQQPSMSGSDISAQPQRALLQAHNQNSPLARLARAQPDLTSMAFLEWLAAQEAAATGSQKRVLDAICAELVTLREVQDQERMDLLYNETVAAITAHAESKEVKEGPAALLPTPSSEGSNVHGDATPASPSSSSAVNPDKALVAAGSTSALDIVRDPTQYAVQLAEAVTGEPVQLQGYSPTIDAILRLSPPAALTPEGIKKVHQEAADLTTEVKDRRKRSVAALIGRAKLTPEQADMLLAGTASARILDMLLSLPAADERISLLPDCFTPPAVQASSSSTGSSAAPGDEALPTDELWCTPAQLLSELDSRLAAIDQPTGASKGPGDVWGPPPVPRMIQGAAGQLTGPELRAALAGLRTHVWDSWMQGMGDSLETREGGSA